MNHDLAFFLWGIGFGVLLGGTIGLKTGWEVALRWVGREMDRRRL